MVSTGTGIVLTADGYIVTNAHIIAGAEQVNVTLSDDSLWSAQLVGFEPLEDLAVLKIDASGLTPAQFGDDTLLRSGDPVSAIGNPMGSRPTITPGIVSALDQPVSVEGTTMYLLQTSAAINYGSSGGALLNDRGQVVGVTTIKIVVLGLIAFAFGTAAGVIFGKIMCKVTGGKVNPLIGSAGVSAVPMAARVSQKVGSEADPSNFLLMHAMGPNVAGVIGTAVAAGTFMAMFGVM